MISLKTDSEFNTTGISEITNVFSPYFAEDLTVLVEIKETYVRASAAFVCRRVLNDGTTACVKLCLYLLLSELSGVTLPWGALSGVKPLKRMMALKAEGFSDEEAKASMKLKYMISDEKLELTARAAEVQKSLLYPHPNARALYIHIPLCPSKCSYCSFPSTVTNEGSELCENYLNALIKELKAVDSLYGEGYYDCVYIGGGTPSVLGMKQIEVLMRTVVDMAPYADEISFEAGRADTTTVEKLKLLKQSGVTRISLNPQSFCDKTLKSVNRNLKNADFLATYEAAVRAGIDNINTDLIFGLPGETRADYINSLSETIKLDPANITLHSLCAKRSAVIDKAQTFAETEDVSDFMDKAFKLLRNKAYEPYYLYRQKYCVSNAENVGYTHPGKACIYNIRMMGDTESVTSAGAASAMKLYFPESDRFENIYNVKEISLYINNIDAVIEKKIRLIKEYLSL